MNNLEKIQQLAKYYREVFRYLNSEKSSTIKNILKSNKRKNPFVNLFDYLQNFEIDDLIKDPIIKISLNNQDQERAKKFYQELKFIHEKIKQPSQEGAKQLYLCFPFLVFNSDEKEIYTPVYILPIDITHNIDKNEIEIRTLSDVFELNFYGLKEIFGEELEEYFDQIDSEIPINEFKNKLPAQLRKIFNLRPDLEKNIQNFSELDQNLSLINLENIIESLENINKNKIYLRKNLVIWILNRVDYHVEKVLQNIISLENLNLDETSIKEIFSEEQTGYNDTNNEYGEIDGIKKHEIYTVLPSNKEQLDVIRWALKNKITVVEGPPGTGKSHTITNLALHLLKEGKKILITSYTTKALDVVVNKIEKINLENEIVHISWLRGDKEGRKRLLNFLKNLKYLFKPKIDINLRRFESLIDEKTKLENIFSDYINKEKFLGYFVEKLKDINDLDILDSLFSFIEIIDFNERELNSANRPEEYFNRLKNNAKIRFRQINFDLDIKKFEEFLSYYYKIKQEGFFSDAYFLNDVEFLKNLNKYLNEKIKDKPSIYIEEKNKIFNNFKFIKEIYNNLESKKLVFKFFENLNFLIEDFKEVEMIFNYFRELQELLNKNKIPSNKLKNFIEALDLLNKLNILNSNDIEKFETILNSFLQEIINIQKIKKFFLLDKIISLFIRDYYTKKYQKILDIIKENKLNSFPEIRIDEISFFENKRNIKDLELIIKKYLEHFNILKKFFIFRSDIIKVTDKYYQKAQSVHFTELLSYTQNILLEELFNSENHYQNWNSTIDDFLKQMNFISELINNFLLEIEKQYIFLPIFYKSFSFEEIFKDFNSFEFFINKLLSLLEEQYRDLYSLIQNENNMIVALKGFYKIIETGEILNSTPASLVEKIITFQIIYKKYQQETTNINEIIQKISENSEQIRRFIKNQIDYKINEYLSQYNRRDSRINIENLRRLLRKGKNNISSIEELKKRIDFNKLLEIFRLWIVNVNDVFRIFPFKAGLFDYVIIDEASQLLPIYLLPLMIISKNIVVIGDDKQLRSPELLFYREDLNKIFLEKSGFDSEDKVLSLFVIDRESSCLGILGTINKKVIGLREHYRCIPEIIKWSNEKFYKNSLIIMTNTEDKIDNIFEFVYVDNALEENKINKKEAQKVIKDLISILKNKKYQEFSIGVITPFREQAEYLQYLFIKAKEQDPELERICNDKEQKLNERVIISTIDGFQGDERDIILYSFRYAPNSSPQIFTIERGELGPNRINVAFTRARRKMIFYLSRPVEEFPPGLIRDFLEYAKTPLMESREEKKFDSWLEEDVYSRLKEKGFNPIPQYPSCGFYIDLALFINDKKIGIECDGWQHYDRNLNLNIDDIERQEILERAGWKIFRIPSTIYKKDPEGFLEDLIDSINKYIGFKKDKEELEELKEEVLKQGPITELEKKEILDIFINSKIWFKLAKWAKENNRFTKRDRKFLYDIGKLIQKHYELTEKQKKYASRLFKIAINKGFNHEQKEN